jgi:hypothetical protein
MFPQYQKRSRLKNLQPLSMSNLTIALQNRHPENILPENLLENLSKRFLQLLVMLIRIISYRKINLKYYQ